jgi:uncharacterized membrane protein (TIGR01666 family)
MIIQKFRDVQYFFYSQALADGFRATFAILLPGLIGSYTGHFEEGLSISLGAMCVSLTDAPGPILNKRNGMLFCAAFAFLIALLTGFVQKNPYLMGIEVAVVTFFFSMFVVYGARATGVGNAAVLVMILTMDKPLPNNLVFPHALLIFSGGLLYLSLSILLYRIRPYRHAQRALGECIREIANYLSIRADFYNTKTDLETDYKRLVAQQIIVNEKQDLVREVFFKTRQIVEESTDESRKLIFTFIETVDLFEDITAAYYDYRSLRKLYAETGALDIIHEALKKVVDELHAVGFAILGNTSFHKSFDYNNEIKSLKTRIDALDTIEASHKLVLRKIIVNIRNLLSGLDKIEQYFSPDLKLKKTGVDHSHFVTHQPLDPKIFVNNLNIQSSAFRHAVRVCSACILGYMLTKILHYGTHSYWILLTIAFIIKPAFSLTKQRNIERIIGTLAGGAFGVAVLLLVDNKTALFVIMMLLMVATYSFMRLNYLVMVVCTTPYVLILFSLLGAGYNHVIKERVLDTLIGCAIAFSASYFLFPSWEADQLHSFMKGIVKANAIYLQKIVLALSGHKVSMLEYKLARKDVYLNSANLSAAFQRMLSEPKSKQTSQSQVQQFVVLNHILFSNIATIATSLITHEAKPYHPEIVHLARKAFSKLADSVKKFGEEEETIGLPEETSALPVKTAPDELLIREQLRFIYGVSKDIDKLSNALTSATK